MRLPESKIKQAVLHPDSEVRYAAVEYFSQSYSQDTTVMPLVIEAAKRYRWQNAYLFIGCASTLPQTVETVRWIFNELNSRKINQKEIDQFNYLSNLGRMLYHAEPGLLLQFESEIVECPGLMPKLKEDIQERLKMLTWSGERCWQALEDFCEAGKDKQYVNEVNLGYASRVVEALARHGENYIDRVLELLAMEVADDEVSIMNWLEPLLVELAGEMRLEPAIPLIIEKLKLDTDFLAEQCMYALTKIGSSSVVQAIYEIFHDEDWHFRLYSSGVLENIHSDLSVKRCLELLKNENDPTINTDLAIALLSNFAYDGIEAVRQLILSGEWEPHITDLREDLVVTCTIMGERFPEYEQWKKQAEQERFEREKRTEQLLEELYEDDSQNEFAGDEPASPHGSKQVREQFAKPFRRDTPKVGRNDPCPCGSGKKYKKCCMGRV